MSYNLNFKNKKKTFMTVTLPDVEETKLFVKICDKATIERFINIKDELSNVDESDQLSAIYEVVTELLNCNMNGVKLTQNLVEALLDFEDLIEFIKMYSDFVSSFINRKN